jgi:hypothetical protein
MTIGNSGNHDTKKYQKKGIIRQKDKKKKGYLKLYHWPVDACSIEKKYFIV